MVVFLLEYGADPNKALSFKANGAPRYPGDPPFNPEIVKILNHYAEQQCVAAHSAGCESGRLRSPHQGSRLGGPAQPASGKIPAR